LGLCYEYSFARLLLLRGASGSNVTFESLGGFP
jgi:hypothetical protein